MGRQLMEMEMERPGVVATPAVSAWREVQPNRGVTKISRVLLFVFLILPPVLALAPWRQSVSGSGRVIAYAPLDRQFHIEAPVGGRVREWLVAEGSKVKKGEIIAKISDNDPRYVEALEEQLSASRHKLEAAKSEVSLYEDVAGRFETVREMAMKAAENGVEAAVQKVRSEEQELAAAQVAQETDKLQYDRLTRLLPAGLASSREYELADQKYRESSAKRLKAAAALAASKSELEAKKAYQAEVGSKTLAEVGKAKAESQKTAGKVDEARKELQDVQVKLRRQNTQDVVAARDGTILRLLVNAGTEQVKEGDPVAILVPDTDELAVEMWVDGNDAPLVHKGDPVRLQFEGWPAVQFAGWPSVAVGSFGGSIALVDSTDNGKGKFRVVIRPDRRDAWPEGRYLRQGVRAKGWVLLGEVRLSYEIWRRMNGFPQSITGEKAESGGKSAGGAIVGDEPTLEEKVKSKRPKE